MGILAGAYLPRSVALEEGVKGRVCRSIQSPAVSIHLPPAHTNTTLERILPRFQSISTRWSFCG